MCCLPLRALYVWSALCVPSPSLPSPCVCAPCVCRLPVPLVCVCSLAVPLRSDSSARFRVAKSNCSFLFFFLSLLFRLENWVFQEIRVRFHHPFCVPFVCSSLVHNDRTSARIACRCLRPGRSRPEREAANVASQSKMSIKVFAASYRV